MTLAPVQAIRPVVIAGGGGTRLWPLSRTGHPKQFLSLTGSRLSLFQQSIDRLRGLGSAGYPLAPPLVVTHEDYRFLVRDQLAEMALAGASIVLEPTGRNTAPALTLAALAAMEDGTDPVLVVTPADHGFTDVAAMTAAIQQAVALADSGCIVVLGVPAIRPETGYGYLRSSGEASAPPRVEQFVEKPDLATAQAYLDSGRFHWNSGIFVLKGSTWLTALTRFRPDIAAATRLAWQARSRDADFIRPGTAEFAQVPAQSVDYAVMEHCPGSEFDIRMVALDAGWSDLGAWDAVWLDRVHDSQGNTTHGDTVLHASRNTLVHATSRLVAVVGLDDAVVVETADAVLVMDRGASQQVKNLVGILNDRQRSETSLPRKVHRPWGWYDSIDSGPRFQVKRIMVNPGASLSLQMHRHRAEHWVVVSGTARVTKGPDTFDLTENQSTYIPMGEKHRLMNPGPAPLEIIEVQSGQYLGEDDIVRFDDSYGRA